ncbi:DUF397 domain-containing protein [Actinomadura bangladeshensis]|uniref:DUF397 domain-containing protein n=1 Tax=Actinomadura bangladeshensis TaxID=453573 RepID=A0A6L9QSH2_9ACTN|nr:DUF397 domain-containing protein [Actinomadura bangladeshensis]NEA27842.1 DUF397 domain-containing protein [Actinomadura bangladeshensis]
MNHWRKSSHSGSQSQNCVECARLPSGHHVVIGVRDSTDPDGPRLALSREAWGALLNHLKRDGS